MSDTPSRWLRTKSTQCENTRRGKARSDVAQGVCLRIHTHIQSDLCPPRLFNNPIMQEDTIDKVLEVRRNLNEQYTALLYIEADTEQDEKDITNLKGMLNGAIKTLNGYAERLIKRSRGK